MTRLLASFTVVGSQGACPSMADPTTKSQPNWRGRSATRIASARRSTSTSSQAILIDIRHDQGPLYLRAMRRQGC